MSRQYSQYVRREGCRQHMLLQDKGHAPTCKGLARDKFHLNVLIQNLKGGLTIFIQL
jgi:hypothetical protein